MLLSATADNIGGNSLKECCQYVIGLCLARDFLDASQRFYSVTLN